MQLSVTVRNAVLDAIESTIGASPVLRMYTGSIPANCATGATGTLLAELQLPSDWMNSASGGVKTMLGTWQDSSANATGVAGYYRIYENSGTTCHEQGTITATGGGGDLTLDNTTITAGQLVSITGWAKTAPNA